MKNYDRKVALLCPLCGNDQFESLDEKFEDLLHASDEVRVRCSDCGSKYTKHELIDSNAAIIDADIPNAILLILRYIQNPAVTWAAEMRCGNVF